MVLHDNVAYYHLPSACENAAWRVKYYSLIFYVQQVVLYARNLCRPIKKQQQTTHYFLITWHNIAFHVVNIERAMMNTRVALLMFSSLSSYCEMLCVCMCV